MSLVMTLRSPGECRLHLVAALSVLCVVASSHDFRPGYLSVNLIGQRTVRVLVNYTSASKPDVTIAVSYRGRGRPTIERPKKHIFANNQGQVTYDMTDQLQVNLDFTFALPQTIFTLFLHPLPPAESHTEPIPDVHFEPQGDILYAENGDVSIDVTVPAGVGRESLSETLSCTSYLRNGSYFYVSEDWPISIVEPPASDSGGVYRLEFNASVPRPEGVLVFQASKRYSDQGSGPVLVRRVELEHRVDIYPQNHPTPVTPDTLALVRQWTDSNLDIQQCDLSLTPVCSVTCAAVGPKVSAVNLQKVSPWGRVTPLEDTVTSSKMDFLTMTSGPVRDVGYTGDIRLSCTTKLSDGSGSVQEQQILLQARRSSYAEWHNDVMSMVVVCKARGLPLPNVFITADEDPDNTPLHKSFADESYFTVKGGEDEVHVRLWLSLPHMYPHSHVRCVADNGFREPDVYRMEITDEN